MSREFTLFAVETFNGADIVGVTHWATKTQPPSMFVFEEDYLNICHPDFNSEGLWVGSKNPLYGEIVEYCKRNGISIVEAWANFERGGA